MRHPFGEPTRDPELGAALRRIDPASSLGDDEPVRRRILAAARGRLNDLRSPLPTLWEIMSGWVRVTVPLGLAAGLVAALLVPGSARLTWSPTYSLDGGTDSTLVLAALSERTPGAFPGAALTEPESDDWLLEQAISQ
jgi:hypothetical protein